MRVKQRAGLNITSAKESSRNIVDFAHTENIDLLVISTHGAGGLALEISSITQK